MNGSAIPEIARRAFSSEYMLEGGTKRELQDGQLVLLTRGCVAVEKATGQMLRVHWPGEIMGGASQRHHVLMTSHFSQASVAAVAEAMRVHGGFAEWYLARAMEAEQMFQNRIDWFVNLRAEDRILRVVADLMYRALETTGTAAIPLAQAQIAQLAGATRETASMLLHRLRKDNLVTYHRRWIEAPDPERLRQLAGWPERPSAAQQPLPQAALTVTAPGFVR